MSVLVDMDRAGLHAELDAFLDQVEKDPLNVEDGEGHTFTLEGGGVAWTDADVRLASFDVTTSKTRGPV